MIHLTPEIDISKLTVDKAQNFLNRGGVDAFSNAAYHERIALQMLSTAATYRRYMAQRVCMSYPGNSCMSGTRLARPFDGLRPSPVHPT